MKIDTLMEFVQQGMRLLVSSAEFHVDSLMNSVERRVDQTLVRVRRKILLVFIQGVLLSVALVTLLLAVILFAKRFFPIEAVLLVVGALAVYVLLMIGLLRK